MNKQGILYLAKGQKVASEAVVSASQLRTLMPDIPMSIVTDQELEVDIFDNIIKDKRDFDKKDKPYWLKRTPYTSTLYLDSDIWAERPVYDLFELLEEFDIGVAKDPAEPHIFYTDDSSNDVPESFPELNTGVILFQKNSRTKHLFERWISNFTPSETRDQRPFRSAMYESEAQMTVLPPRYNCMYRELNSVNGPVKLFHGQLVDRGMNKINIQRAVNRINSTTQRRCVIPYKQDLMMRPPLSLYDHTIETLRQDGLRTFLYNSIVFLLNYLRGRERSDIENRNTEWSDN